MLSEQLACCSRPITLLKPTTDLDLSQRKSKSSQMSFGFRIITTSSSNSNSALALACCCCRCRRVTCKSLSLEFERTKEKQKCIRSNCLLNSSTHSNTQKVCVCVCQRLSEKEKKSFLCFAYRCLLSRQTLSLAKQIERAHRDRERTEQSTQTNRQFGKQTHTHKRQAGAKSCLILVKLLQSKEALVRVASNSSSSLKSEVIERRKLKKGQIANKAAAGKEKTVNLVREGS